MCGIAGAINLKKFDKESIYTLMQHRGPDASGAFYDTSIAGLLQFFHARLSIQDLSITASQPMVYRDLCLVFNGEIYNHLQFREGLDFPFKTHSDTETLLALFATKGIDFFKHLNDLDGMFAFALYDRAEQKVYFARDRMGKKPLFYFHKRKQFAFGSELRVLQEFLDDLELDKESIGFYLQSGYFYKDGSPYNNIASLPNASFAVLNLVTMDFTITPYFDLESCYKAPKISDEAEALVMCEELLQTSIKSRIESSDLEVGAFLSGGIDSALIVALSANIKPNLRTFTVCFEGSFNEAPLAKLTAMRYNTIHKELKISTNLKEDVPKILQNYGRPFFDSSAIPSYYVAKAAKEYVSVILNGDGADELFGGYRRYVGHLLVPKILPFLPLLKPFFKILPKPQTKQSLHQYIFRLVQMAEFYKKDLAQYYFATSTDIFTNFAYFNPLESFCKEINRIFKSDLSELSKMLLIDSKNLLLSDLLPKMDIATMAHALEGRSPFLSKGLVEFAPRLDDTLKVRKNCTKYLLRKLAQKYLDRAVFNAPKRGFEVPLAHWVDTELKDLILQTLQNPKIALGFLEKNMLESLCFEAHKYPKQKRAKMLWSLFALEIWYQNQKR